MNTQSNRLHSGQTNPDRPVHFSFDGRNYTGNDGDTLASALLANDVHLVARSFKYHRPRGILGAGSEDPAALVQIGDGAQTTPNQRATEVEIYNGLKAHAQNCWPTLNFDIGAVNDLIWRFLPAGFYYKTFMGPPFDWMYFEKLIRASAGLGKAPTVPDPDRYEHCNRHCDVLVIGAGPAGLSAALAAGATGARVILAEETASPGGQLLTETDDIALDGVCPVDWIKDALRRLHEMPEVTVLTRTCAFGYHTENWVGLEQSVQDHIAPAKRDGRLPARRIWRVRARQIVLATGAVERPLVFHRNDRPGIMLAGAVRSYLHKFGVAAGKAPLIFTNNSSGWKTAFDLAEAGIAPVGIVDTRCDPEERLMRQAARLGIPVHSGAVITDTFGRRRIRSVTIHAIGVDGQVTGASRKIKCDLVAVSGGWSPNVALFSQSRGRLQFDTELAAFRPEKSWQHEKSAGACNGAFDLETCLQQGGEAGKLAADVAGFEGGNPTPVATGGTDMQPYAIEARWMLPTSVRQPRAFIDLQNDVTIKDLKLALQEGYSSVEHAKRYTTLGMGTDQGKTSGVNGFGVLSELLEKPIPEVGVTTFRPPYKPVSFGAIAGPYKGKLFHPRRTTPLYDWHQNAGAEFEVVGDWLRARCYPKGDESGQQAVVREVLAARNEAAVLDASTLGKIDIRGPDAREFLNRIYTNSWTKLQPDRCRYGLMLNENGMVFDDGVTACLADDHFHMTTTTGGAAIVLAHLEDYLQTEWPELKVYLTSVTEHWAVASLCGPKSEEIAASLFDDIQTDEAAFPFMAARSGHIDGVPVRVFNISFTGEKSFEINIPSRYGSWLWQRIIEKGATPYGTDAMHLLRAEKGFIIVGQDTDGTVTPHDLGMSWAVKNSGDFVGKRSLSRSDTARKDRFQLIGLLTHDPDNVLPEGAQIIAGEHETLPKTPMIGHVTSSYFSPNLQRSIALALVAGGHGRIGEYVHVASKDADPVVATICDTDFLQEFRSAT